jgi:hypothetical protein
MMGASRPDAASEEEHGGESAQPGTAAEAVGAEACESSRLLLLASIGRVALGAAEARGEVRGKEERSGGEGHQPQESASGAGRQPPIPLLPTQQPAPTSRDGSDSDSGRGCSEGGGLARPLQLGLSTSASSSSSAAAAVAVPPVVKPPPTALLSTRSSKPSRKPSVQLSPTKMSGRTVVSPWNSS